MHLFHYIFAYALSAYVFTYLLIYQIGSTYIHYGIFLD